MTESTATKPKLVIFDVEGVIIPKNRLYFEIGRTLGFVALLKILFFGFLYQVGILPLKRALVKIFHTMAGVKITVFDKILTQLPLMPGTKEVFAFLKAQGSKTALISSGLPTFLVQKLALSFGAEYAFGIEVGINGDALTGEIWGDPIERKGKLLILKKIVELEGLKLNECAVIGDDRNNVSLFFDGIQKIGYHPDFVIRAKADFVINGSLSNVLIALNPKAKVPSLSARNLLREFIHASAFLIAVFALFLGQFLVALIICSLIAIYIVSEFERLRGKNFPVISQITRNAASQSELCDFTLAPLYFAFGILFTLLIFPYPANSAAIAIFALGDSSASIIGGFLPKKPLPLNRGKTLTGTLGGFFFGFLAGSVFVSPWLALIGAATATIIEYLPLPVNDNLLMPICTGFVLTFLI
ncbi:MAG: haloacid dehalogenase-like hydrolase [Candidatus Bathyarchaeota archaeon]|nr:haloacid dehalogenase-like hydrolase [Candidatus Bathyarchaeota archaeon]